MLKNIKPELRHFCKSVWAMESKCHTDLVWSQLFKFFFLSLFCLFLLLVDFTHPPFLFKWLWAYELAQALPCYTPQRGFIKEGRRSHQPHTVSACTSAFWSCCLLASSSVTGLDDGTLQDQQISGYAFGPHHDACRPGYFGQPRWEDERARILVVFVGRLKHTHR